MFLDRLVAVSASMATALYLMAGALAWYRLFRPRSWTSKNVKSVILDRAVAWSSLVVIFYTVLAIKMGWFDWSDDWIDIARVISFLAIWACGLLSIRAMTLKYFGYSAVGWFGFFSLLAGVVTYFI